MTLNDEETSLQSKSQDPIARVLICDDHEVVRDGLRTALARAPNLSIVGEAANAQAAVAMALRLEPELVIMDLKMPSRPGEPADIRSGAQATSDIKRTKPSIRVVILTTFDEPSTARLALSQNPDGFLLKDADGKQIVRYLYGILDGVSHLAPPARELVRRSLGPVAPNGLTEREKEVLELVGRGLSNPQIASGLWISPKTVKRHLEKIYLKLGVHDRTAAAMKATRLGLIRAEGPP